MLCRGQEQHWLLLQLLQAGAWGKEAGVLLNAVRRHTQCEHRAGNLRTGGAGWEGRG